MQASTKCCVLFGKHLLKKVPCGLGLHQLSKVPCGLHQLKKVPCGLHQLSKVPCGLHQLKKVPCGLHQLSTHAGKEPFGDYWRRNLRLLGHEIFDKVRGSKLDTIHDTHKVIMSCETQNIVNEFNIQTDDAIGGKSWAKLCMSRNNRLLFHGELKTVVPKDGQTERSGYCAVKSKQLYGAFDKKIQLDLTPFNVLKFRIRGDGRSYMINLYTENYFTDTDDDIWSFFLFTRGGPHWQEVTVPFSKFFMSNKGRIQDSQALVDLEYVNCIGLTMADAVDGEFALEIDLITATFDPTHTEEFAYEMYDSRY